MTTSALQGSAGPELVNDFLSDWTHCPRSTATFTVYACQSDVVQPNTVNTAGQANSESHRRHGRDRVAQGQGEHGGPSQQRIAPVLSYSWRRRQHNCRGIDIERPVGEEFVSRGRAERPPVPKSRVRHPVTQCEGPVTSGRTRFRAFSRAYSASMTGMRSCPVRRYFPPVSWRAASARASGGVIAEMLRERGVIDPGRLGPVIDLAALGLVSSAYDFVLDP
jgi:hypothetical protein